jgi:pimeloyl-ACP methyl ester carboxylesterase
VRYRTAAIHGHTVFYREAGQAAAPTVQLLHGFPTSSHMFRDLIPLLADRFHVIAPDYIGFGQSDAPSHTERDAASETGARQFLAAGTTKFQYLVGAHDPEAISPDNWTIDQALLDRPGVDLAQLDLLEDYKSNVALYDRWQAAFRQYQPRTLILWGRSDPFFIPAGAEAYLRDLSDARLVWLDAGHFVLDENAEHVAAEIKAQFAPG